MGMVDSVGTFIGEIADSGVTTSKNGFPQWIVRVKAEQKYVDDADGMAHFKLTEPGYVDWSTFNEEITGFLVLFNNADVFNKDTSLMNYEQVQLATGWDGSEFDSLANGSLLGKKILFRTEENEYNGKTSIRVGWVDAADASPTRTLKSLDTDGIKALSAKLKITKTAKPAATVAKPTTAKPAAGKPTTAPTTAKTTTAPAAKTTAPKPPKTAAPKPTEETLPKEVSKDDAWAYLMAHKGGNEDGNVADAWQAALAETVGEDRAVADNDITEAEWAKVRDIVIKDLSLT